MDNLETLATLGHTRHRTKTIQRHWQHRGIQDTGRRQSRDTGNIGHTGHRTKTIQRHWQHWGIQDTGRRQSRDTGNIGAYKTQDEDNLETLAT